MTFLRRIPTKHLILLCAAVVAVAAGGTALAIAAGAGGPKPRAKALPVAIRDALSAPAPAGVTARIEFTNQLVDSSGVHGSNPILTGAKGRLWASADGHFRLELQSSGGGADAQVVSDGKSFWIYDGSSNTVYRGQLPQGHAATATKAKAKAKERKADKPLTIARIKSALAKLAKHATVSQATPDNVGGEPAYSVTLSPRRDGGLLDSAALAWDAAHGVPLRLGVYAKGHPSPVLELKATEISFGPVAKSDLAISPPAGAKTVDLTPAKPEPPTAADKAGKRAHAKPVAGLAAVQRAVHFKLAAPPSLGGLPRAEVRLLGGKTGKSPTVLVTYGQGLGGIAVLQQTAKATTTTKRSAAENSGPVRGLELPKVSINGAPGQELDTALGTVIRFERGGVSYTVLGSVAPATALAAARGL
jgi:outer membrane lipoprotein-sorting protein